MWFAPKISSTDSTGSIYTIACSYLLLPHTCYGNFVSQPANCSFVRVVRRVLSPFVHTQPIVISSEKEALASKDPNPKKSARTRYFHKFTTTQTRTMSLLIRPNTIQTNRALLYSRRLLLKASFTTQPPGKDPLALIQKECHARNLCDELGVRRAGAHWVFSIAISPDDLNQVRSLIMSTLVAFHTVQSTHSYPFSFSLRTSEPSVCNGFPRMGLTSL